MVVHNHSAAVIPFGVSKVPFKPIAHVAGFLPQTTPIVEIRDKFGPASDMQVRDAAKGADLARTIADNPVVLMRGHGSTMVGASVPQVVYRAIYTEVNAKLESNALRLGEPVYLSAEEAANTPRANDGQLSRPRGLWKQRVMDKATEK